MLNECDKACEYFRILNPIEHTRTKEAVFKYKVEPYVVSADIYSNLYMQGRGGWSWYTGSSSWLYIAGLEYILGIKKEGNKLNIKPCISSEWEAYNIEFHYYNAIYRISVYNEKSVNSKIKTVYLDNDEIKGESEGEKVYVELEPEGNHKVDIILE